MNNPYADQVRKQSAEFYETMPTRALVRNVREHTEALCGIVEDRLGRLPAERDSRAWGWGLVLGCAVSSGFWILVFALLYAAAHKMLCN